MGVRKGTNGGVEWLDTARLDLVGESGAAFKDAGDLGSRKRVGRALRTVDWDVCVRGLCRQEWGLLAEGIVLSWVGESQIAIVLSA